MNQGDSKTSWRPDSSASSFKYWDYSCVQGRELNQGLLRAAWKFPDITTVLPTWNIHSRQAWPPQPGMCFKVFPDALSALSQFHSHLSMLMAFHCPWHLNDPTVYHLGLYLDFNLIHKCLLRIHSVERDYIFFIGNFLHWKFWNFSGGCYNVDR